MDTADTAQSEQSAQYDGPCWPKTIKRHEDQYLARESDEFRRAIEMYQGRYWSPEQRKARGGVVLASFNLVYAITESAVSAMIPANLRFTVAQVRGIEQIAPPELEQDINDMARDDAWLTEARISITDAVLCGRSALKVMPAPDKTVTVRAIRPAQLRFDLTARRPSDITWYAEMRLVQRDDAVRSVLDGDWRLPPAYGDAPAESSVRDYFASQASAWPAALGSDAAAASQETRDYVVVWEVWDCKRRQLSLWAGGTVPDPTPLTWEQFTEDEWAVPYILYNLNYNAENMLGLSEVQLCADNIDTINRFLTWMMAAVRTQVPTTLYNGGMLAEEDVVRIAQAQPGDFVAVNPQNSGADLRSLFAPTLQATLPKDLSEMLAKLESIVQYVSALADAARGQVTGARTATELALIESQQRTRLATRIAAFHNAWSQAAALVAWHLTGRRAPLRILRRNTELTAYNATGTNRAVIRERFQELLAFMQGVNEKRADNPVFDEKMMYRLFIEAFDLPPGLLNTEALEEEEDDEGPEAGEQEEPGEMPEMPMPPGPGLGLPAAPAPPPPPGGALPMAPLPPGLPV